MAESKLCGWIWYENGVFDRDMSGVGMLYNVHYNTVEAIVENVFKCPEDFLEDILGDEGKFVGSGYIDFELTNLEWDRGQMTFPETGQWDFAPHWEFDFNVVKHEQYSEKDYTSDVLLNED